MSLLKSQWIPVPAGNEQAQACSGSESYLTSSGPCAGQIIEDAGYLQRDDYLTISPTGQAYAGWIPRIEVDPSLSRARVCVEPYTDAIDSSCSTALHNERILCADSGAVVISEILENEDGLPSIQAHVNVAFPTFELRGTFSASAR